MSNPVCWPVGVFACPAQHTSVITVTNFTYRLVVVIEDRGGVYDTHVYIIITNLLTGSFTCGAGHEVLTHFSQRSPSQTFHDVQMCLCPFLFCANLQLQMRVNMYKVMKVKTVYC